MKSYDPPKRTIRLLYGLSRGFMAVLRICVKFVCIQCKSCPTLKTISYRNVKHNVSKNQHFFLEKQELCHHHICPCYIFWPNNRFSSDAINYKLIISDVGHSGPKHRNLDNFVPKEEYLFVVNYQRPKVTNCSHLLNANMRYH